MVAVQVELRALVKLARVLDGERVEAEQRAERLDLLVARVLEIDPEEALAVDVLAELVEAARR